MSPGEAARAPGTKLLALAAAGAGLAVATGAMGAHLLRERLTAGELGAWQTASQYQMYHSLALLVLARVISRRPAPLFRAAANLFLAGIVLFSGSLYALALTGESRFGMVTPFGGVAFIAGWGCFAAGALKHRG